MKALISSVSLSVLILICFWHCRLATASLLIPQKDEGKAHVCVMAWLQHLRREGDADIETMFNIDHPLNVGLAHYFFPTNPRQNRSLLFAVRLAARLPVRSASLVPAFLRRRDVIGRWE